MWRLRYSSTILQKHPRTSVSLAAQTKLSMLNSGLKSPSTYAVRRSFSFSFQANAAHEHHLGNAHASYPTEWTFTRQRVVVECLWSKICVSLMHVIFSANHGPTNWVGLISKVKYWSYLNWACELARCLLFSVTCIALHSKTLLSTTCHANVNSLGATQSVLS